MKKNNGFTMIELLGAVTLLGILSLIAVVAYSRYAESVKIKSHDMMAKSAMSATEQYLMKNAIIENGSVSFQDLTDSGFFSSTVDPDDNNQTCNGSVEYEYHEGTAGSLGWYNFKVSECCTKYKATYIYKYDDTDHKYTESKRDVGPTEC